MQEARSVKFLDVSDMFEAWFNLSDFSLREIMLLPEILPSIESINLLDAHNMLFHTHLPLLYPNLKGLRSLMLRDEQDMSWTQRCSQLAQLTLLGGADQSLLAIAHISSLTALTLKASYCSDSMLERILSANHDLASLVLEENLELTDGALNHVGATTSLTSLCLRDRRTTNEGLLALFQNINKASGKLVTFSLEGIVWEAIDLSSFEHIPTTVENLLLKDIHEANVDEALQHVSNRCVAIKRFFVSNCNVGDR